MAGRGTFVAALVTRVYNEPMRALAIVVVVACRAPAATGPASLPDEPRPIADVVADWTAGEQTTWNVFLGGLLIGRAHLALGATEARSTFQTGVLASVVEPVRHELISRRAGAAVTEVIEVLTIDGHTQRTRDVREGAAPLHSLHSALGVVRAWSRSDRRPGYLWIVHLGEPYRLDVFPPAADRVLGVSALRVEGVARTADGATARSFTLWLAANRDRTPLRFVLDGGVSAEAVESTASFE